MTRIKLLIAAASLTLISNASAVVSFTGQLSSNLKKSNGTTNVEVGRRFLIIVDNGGNGFGASSTNTVASGVTFTAGGTFGDANDFIIESDFIGSLAGRATATVVNNDAWDATYGGKQFALIWFDSLTSLDSSTADGNKYGFTRDASWIMPSIPGGTYDFTTSPAVATDIRQMGGAGFLPGGTTLTIGVAPIPEPSRMMLLGLGLFGLFFRRRR